MPKANAAVRACGFRARLRGPQTLRVASQLPENRCPSPKQGGLNSRLRHPLVMRRGTISCRAPRRESLLPLQSALWRESRGPSLCEHGVPPSHDVRHRDAWPLPRGGGRHAYDVLMPSCGVPQLSSTWDFLDSVVSTKLDISEACSDISHLAGEINRPNYAGKTQAAIGRFLSIT
jgi:hypothetical protein